MHGIGNDYVYVNGFVETIADPAAIAIKVSDRHFGIGSDGLILILPSDKADVRMRMFNADGSESEMCGNGVRCVATYAFTHGLSRNNPMKVETGRGVLTLELKVHAGNVQAVTVDMGEPILELEQIPVKPTAMGHNTAYKRVADHEFSLAIEKYTKNTRCTFVSMGNPHAVFFTDNVKDIALEQVGPVVENYPAFPKRINAHWVQVQSRAEVTMRTWERGSGITLACGTGACAVAVAGVLTGRTDRTIIAHLPGGDLKLEWRESDNHVYMTGAATEVFNGEINL